MYIRIILPFQGKSQYLLKSDFHILTIIATTIRVESLVLVRFALRYLEIDSTSLHLKHFQKDLGEIFPKMYLV